MDPPRRSQTYDMPKNRSIHALNRLTKVQPTLARAVVSDEMRFKMSALVCTVFLSLLSVFSGEE